MARVKTKGTSMYLVDAVGSPDVIELGCVTGINGLGGAAEQIDVTCFSSPNRVTEGGYETLDPVTVDLIYDTEDDAYPELVALRDSQAVVGWYIGGPGSTTAPTADSAGEVVPANDRNGIYWQGYVSNLTWNLPLNDVWRGQLTIQPTTKWQLYRNNP